MARILVIDDDCEMNAMVKIYRTQNSDLEIESILGVKAFDLDRALVLSHSGQRRGDFARP